MKFIQALSFLLMFSTALLACGSSHSGSPTQTNESDDQEVVSNPVCSDEVMASHSIQSQNLPAKWPSQLTDALDCETGNTEEEALEQLVEKNNLEGYSVASQAVCVKWVPRAPQSKNRLCALYVKSSNFQMTVPDQISIETQFNSGNRNFCRTGDGTFESAALSMLNSFIYYRRGVYLETEPNTGFVAYAATGGESIYTFSIANPKGNSALPPATTAEVGQTLYFTGKHAQDGVFLNGQFCLNLTF